jgi:hypothetical protein
MEKHCVTSLSPDFLVLDFKGIHVHNDDVRERMLFWIAKKDGYEKNNS